MYLTVAFRNFANAPKTVKYTDFKIKDRWCSLQKGEARRGVDEGFAILGFSVMSTGKTVHLLNVVLLIFSELHGPLCFITFINRCNFYIIITNLNSMF
jgi:hypothetical protein